MHHVQRPQQQVHFQAHLCREPGLRGQGAEGAWESQLAQGLKSGSAPSASSKAPAPRSGQEGEDLCHSGS